MSSLNESDEIEVIIKMLNEIKDNYYEILLKLNELEDNNFETVLDDNYKHIIDIIRGIQRK